MESERLLGAVREQLSLGRLVPLGSPSDGAWLAERAARAPLRRAAEAGGGVRLGRLRIDRIGPDAAVPARPVPLPPSALPPGPLRLAAEFSADMSRPLPARANELREVLTEAATARLGLDVATVNLRVTDLLEQPECTHGAAAPGPGLAARKGTASGAQYGEGVVAAVAGRVSAVHGVLRLPDLVVGPGRAVMVEDDLSDGAGRQVRVQVIADGHRPLLETVRAVSSAAVEAAEEGSAFPVTVAVLVTDVVLSQDAGKSNQ